MHFDGLLFFPVTPFRDDYSINIAALTAHIEERLESRPGAIFVACGTGEFHALSTVEYEAVVRRAVEVVGGQVPVFAGCGGPIGGAKACAHVCGRAGVDGLLILPPYLVAAPQDGLIAYVRAVAGETHLPAIVYSRSNAVFGVDAAVATARIPNVIGFKDGVGDVETLAQIVGAVRADLAPTGKQFSFLNGLPTAEASAMAYRAIGVPLYSSAVFCFLPEMSIAFYNALHSHDHARSEALLQGFFHPLVRLRSKVPGYAVSMVKAAVRLRGLQAGPVRPPLLDLTDVDKAVLQAIIERGIELLASTDRRTEGE